ARRARRARAGPRQRRRAPDARSDRGHPAPHAELARDLARRAHDHRDRVEATAAAFAPDRPRRRTPQRTLMTKTTMSVLLAGLMLSDASGAAAQTADPKGYVDLNIAGQTQSVTLATSSTFSLYGEPAPTSTSHTNGKGLGSD